ncbi:alpha/beta-Hydrolase [Sarocladium implicatum]|nr:alpha/beta-Hydrolase [Sarocladium implicatum]
MKTVSSSIFGLAVAALQAQAQQYEQSEYVVLPEFAGHTIYKPVDLTAFDQMPIMVWGNGACSDNSLSHQNFLLEIASYGIIVVVSGVPNGGGGTTAQTMTASIDWAVQNAGQGDWVNMDSSRIAVAGMSCGGVEAYDNSLDDRVSAVGIFNSGQYDPAGTNANVPPIDKPIFFFLGGETDIAYGNGMRDYAAVTSGVPTWVGNYPSGHGGTYGEPNGGAFGAAGAAYFRWVLRGDETAAPYFTDNGSAGDGWTAESKDLENVSVSPI